MAPMPEPDQPPADETLGILVDHPLIAVDLRRVVEDARQHDVVGGDHAAADVLASPPDISGITPSQDSGYRLIFRLNSNNFDRVDIPLGFSDVASARQFPAEVPFSSFAGVDLSLVAASNPGPTAQLPD